jgi:hypothetical protein
MLIPFGVLSAAAGGAGPAGGAAYELIATEILTTSETSVTFSNLGDYSSTYKHLQIRGVAKSDRGFNDDVYTINVNGNALTNNHGLNGNGSSVVSNNADDKRIIWGAGGSTTNAFAAFVVDIMDAYGNKNKTIRALSGQTASGANNIALGSGLWNSTASLTSLTIDPIYGSNFVAGSRFSIYGLKG